jgi:hypothetical protein
MQHGEAEASDPIMRRCLPTAERTMTRQVISAELTEKGSSKGLTRIPGIRERCPHADYHAGL